MLAMVGGGVRTRNKQWGMRRDGGLILLVTALVKVTLQCKEIYFFTIFKTKAA